MNTVLSLCACVLSTLAASFMVGNGKIDMVHIQNSTLAGGVAVGAAADLYLHPSGAMAVGVLAAVIRYGLWAVVYCESKKLELFSRNVWTFGQNSYDRECYAKLFIFFGLKNTEMSLKYTDF